MNEPPVTRCSNCSASLKLKSTAAFGRSLRCPRCGESFVARPAGRRKRRPSTEDSNPYANEVIGDAPAGSDSRQLPGRSRRQQRTPIEDARRKRDELLKKQEDQAQAGRPKAAARALLALVLWVNAHIAVVLTIIDCLVEIAALLSSGAVRQARSPAVIMVLAGIAWYQTVLPRDINSRGMAAGFGSFFVIVCGVVGFATVTALNQVTGYDFFAVRWGAVYLGLSLIVYSIWGYGPETPVEYAERMMANGRFGRANDAVEKVLEKDPDNLQALKIQRELREMLKLV